MLCIVSFAKLHRPPKTIRLRSFLLLSGLPLNKAPCVVMYEKLIESLISLRDFFWKYTCGQCISFLFYEFLPPHSLPGQGFVHAFDARILIHPLYRHSAQFPQTSVFSAFKRLSNRINPLYPQTYPHFSPFFDQISPKLRLITKRCLFLHLLVCPPRNIHYNESKVKGPQWACPHFGQGRRCEEASSMVSSCVVRLSREQLREL